MSLTTNCNTITETANGAGHPVADQDQGVSTMKKLFTAAAFAAAMTGTPAFAEAEDLAITGLLEKACVISTLSNTVTLQNDSRTVTANLNYSCNFLGAPSVTLKSANGGVKTTENGGATQAYAVWLNDAASPTDYATWIQSGDMLAGVTSTSWVSGSTTPNTTMIPVIRFRLLNSLKVAGTYEDTVTVTIEPQP
jgi:spore coat protein U-like protein